jgi:hypothetical protein
MNRIIKIVVFAALAALATAAVASANVAVTDGTGSVGKGDVMNALQYKNDAAFQADAAGVTFQYGDVAEISMAVVCTSDDVTYVTQHNVLGTVTAAKTVNFTTKGDKGKVTGYNLTGASGEATYTSSLDFSKQMACPTGTHFSHYLNGGTWDWDWNALPDSLTVTGSGASAGKTVALPNTPVL